MLDNLTVFPLKHNDALRNIWGVLYTCRGCFGMLTSLLAIVPDWRFVK